MAAQRPVTFDPPPPCPLTTTQTANPRRTALAHKQLVRNLHGPKLRQALGLPVDESGSKPARKSAKRATKEAA